MSRETKVPSIPDIRDDNVLDVLRSIKTVMEVREGVLGDPLDQAATLRDLSDLQLVSTGGETQTQSGLRLPVIPNLPPLPIDGYDPATDYTTPPIPTNLQASGGLTNVHLSWDGAPYRNHSYTEIWRAYTDNLGQATMVATTAANVYGDPAQEDTQYYYWIRFVSVANVTGPYNATSGTWAKTAIYVAKALTVLSEDIQRSSLFIDLGTRIKRIENSSFLTDQQMSVLSDARDRLEQEVYKTGSAIQTTQAITTRTATQINALSSVVYNEDTGLVQTRADFESLATTVSDQTSAIASSVTTLSSQVNDATTGLPATRADLSSNYYTKTLTNSAIAASVGVVSARLNSIDGNGVTLEQSFSAQADAITGLNGKYTVKIDNNGHVSGFGLASEANNGTTASSFIVRADKFALASPTDTTNPLGTTSPTQASTPFMVFTTPTNVTINGQTKTYPAGVWMNSAFIANATIDSAQISSITADQITTGSLTASLGITTGKISGGVNLNYGWGTTNFGTGFYLGNDGGTYKFYVGSPTQNVKWNGSTLSVTGELNALSGVFRNITVYDSQDNVILSSGGVNIGQLGLGDLAFANSVSAANIAGLGSLATQDSVFIGSTVKIYNSTTQSYQTLNTSDFVNSLSKVTSGTIGNFFGTTAITNAYIGNLDAAKITTGFLSADRINAGTLDTKIANIDAAKITSGTIDNARIGTLSAKTIYTGNDASSVSFVDPSAPTVPMKAVASGYYFGGSGWQSGYTNGVPIAITDASVIFKTNDLSWNINRRIKSGTVRFTVIATAELDHFFSLWWTTGSNATIATNNSYYYATHTQEPQGGFGLAALAWSGDITVALGDAVKFGLSTVNDIGVPYNPGSASMRFINLTVYAHNF